LDPRYNKINDLYYSSRYVISKSRVLLLNQTLHHKVKDCSYIMKPNLHCYAHKTTPLFPIPV